MDEEKPPLLKLPLELLNKVTKYIDIITVLRLRKTCRYFKNYVDSGEIDLKLEEITIQREFRDKSYDIRVAIALPIDKLYNLKYGKSGSDCKVWSVEGLDEKKGKVKCIGNGDVAEIAGNDLGLLLRNQKTLMSNISVDGYKIRDSIERLLSSLESQLQSRAALLPVKSLSFSEVTDQSHFMSILPCLDPAFFKDFSRSYYVPRAKHDTNMENIVKTEQWKKAKEVEMTESGYNDSLKDYHHFKRADFEIKGVSSQEVFDLKEAKLQDPSFRWYRFKYGALTDPRLLKKLLGEPLPTSKPFARNTLPKWYYRIPNSDMTLELSRNTNERLFELKVLNIADVPANAFAH